jgi:pilus assembly protein CpaB
MPIAYPDASTVAYGRVEIDPTFDGTFFIYPSEPQRPRLVSQTLIQDVIVLQMGNFPEPGEEEGTPTPVPLDHSICKPVQCSKGRHHPGCSPVFQMW